MKHVRRLSLLTIVAAIGVATLVVGSGVRGSTALFVDQEATSASAASAACFVDDAGAPTVTASIVSKTTPYVGGFIRQGGTYYVYANISGAATRVTADIRPLTAGEFLAPLTAGAYSVGGVAYGWRTASFTAANPLSEGAYTYSVSAADAALQCRTASYTVTVDNTPPLATDVNPINGDKGNKSGKPEEGDYISYRFSEMIDPESLLPGWIGFAGTANVVVRITDNGSNDYLTVWDATNTVQLPLGSVDLAQDYVTTDTTWGASGTPSRLYHFDTILQVHLGTQAGTTRQATEDATAVWTPSAAATDRAGNPSATTIVIEAFSPDRNF